MNKTRAVNRPALLLGVVLVGAFIVAQPSTPAPPVATPSTTNGGLGASLDYVQFLLHVNESQAQGQANFSAVGDAFAAGGGDVDVSAGMKAARPSASYYLEWSTGEVAWLNANRPALCYATLQEDWTATVVTYRKAMNAILADDGSLALTNLNAGTVSMKRTTADLAAVSC